MSRRNAIFLATAVAAVVCVVAYSMRGPAGPGLGAAARNTARFSGLVFALALAARSPRFAGLFAARWNLFWAFIAAHGIHFVAVMVVVLLDQTSPLHQLSPKVIGTLASGFGLVLATALTAGSDSAPFTSRAHTFLFYVVSLLFGVAFFSGARATHPLSALNLAVLVAAFLVRMLPVNRAMAAPA